jgi:hypothetical protein
MYGARRWDWIRERCARALEWCPLSEYGIRVWSVVSLAEWGFRISNIVLIIVVGNERWCRSSGVVGEGRCMGVVRPGAVRSPQYIINACNKYTWHCSSLLRLPGCQATGWQLMGYWVVSGGWRGTIDQWHKHQDLWWMDHHWLTGMYNGGCIHARARSWAPHIALRQLAGWVHMCNWLMARVCAAYHQQWMNGWRMVPVERSVNSEVSSSLDQGSTVVTLGLFFRDGIVHYTSLFR